MCNECIYKNVCLLRGKLDKCPNFKTQIDSCETCKKRERCNIKKFVSCCNGFIFDKKAVTK